MMPDIVYSLATSKVSETKKADINKGYFKQKIVRIFEVKIFAKKKVWIEGAIFPIEFMHGLEAVLNKYGDILEDKTTNDDPFIQLWLDFQKENFSIFSEKTKNLSDLEFRELVSLQGLPEV